MTAHLEFVDAPIEHLDNVAQTPGKGASGYEFPGVHGELVIEPT